jgi:hypothetical protein
VGRGDCNTWFIPFNRSVFQFSNLDLVNDFDRWLWHIDTSSIMPHTGLKSLYKSWRVLPLGNVPANSFGRSLQVSLKLALGFLLLLFIHRDSELN